MENSQTLDIPVAGSVYRFRRWTVRDELAATDSKTEREVLSRTLISVHKGGKTLRPKDLKDCKKIIEVLPTPVYEKMVILYVTEFGKVSVFRSSSIFLAPEPVHIRKVMEDEDAEKAQREDELHEAIETEMEMIRESGYKGATRIQPEDAQ